MLDQLVNDAYQCFGSGKMAEAETLCRQIIGQDPRRAEAVYLLAAIDQSAGRIQAGIEGFRRAADLAPDNPVFINAWGESLHDSGHLDEAFHCYQTATRLRPTYERAHNNLGRILNQRGDLVAAEQCFTEALRLNPNYATAHNNLGGVLLARGQWTASIECCRQALRIRRDYPEPHYNWAAALRALGNVGEAISHLHEAIRLRANYGKAHLLMGHALVDLSQIASAAASFEMCTRLMPDEPQGYHELGNVQLLLERFDEARTNFTRALTLNPNDRKTFAQLCRLKAVVLEWQDQSTDQQVLWNDVTAELEAGRPSPTAPLFTFALPWSGAQLLAVAQSHAQVHERSVLAAPASTSPAGAARDPAGRIKIAYLSRDFYDHAVGHQIQGVFALHDRAKFEVHAYSFGPDDGSIYRRRIANDVESFHDVTSLRDEELVIRIRADGIQILVDLMGYTGFARISCLAAHPAPIQVSWLGYPGTMGAKFIDYLIGDSVVTPTQSADDYLERLVGLPHSYMPTDQSQPILDERPLRADHGLPADATVFCCFHNTYKITPKIFSVWMRILDQVPGSVAWFNVRHPMARANLLREALNRGIDSDRLIFTAHVPDKAAHLSRLRLADLFLDAPYYNAHVTACDALWSGLPVLTLPGQTFSSRVGASLLTAARLPELITANIEEYEQLAVELGNNRAALAALRKRLETDRRTLPLFDSPRFVRNLERAFSKMWENFESGLPPRAFDVTE